MTPAPQYAVEHLFPWESEWARHGLRYETPEAARIAATAKQSWAVGLKTRIVRIQETVTVVAEFTQPELPVEK